MVCIAIPKTRLRKKSEIDIEDEGCVANDPDFTQNAAIINGIHEDLRTCQRKYKVVIPGGEFFTTETILQPNGVNVEGIGALTDRRGESEVSGSVVAGQASKITGLFGGDVWKVTGSGCRTHGFAIQGRRIPGELATWLALDEEAEGKGTRSRGLVVEGAAEPPVGNCRIDQMTFIECSTNIEFEGSSHADQTTIGKIFSNGFAKHIRLNCIQSVGIDIVGQQTLLGDVGAIAYDVAAGGPVKADGTLTLLNYMNSKLLKLGQYSQNTNDHSFHVRFGDGFSGSQTMTAVDLSEADSDSGYDYPFNVRIRGLIPYNGDTSIDFSNFVMPRIVSGKRNDLNVHLQIQNLAALAPSVASAYPW